MTLRTSPLAAFAGPRRARALPPSRAHAPEPFAPPMSFATPLAEGVSTGGDAGIVFTGELDAGSLPARVSHALAVAIGATRAQSPIAARVRAEKPRIATMMTRSLGAPERTRLPTLTRSNVGRAAHGKDLRCPSKVPAAFAHPGLFSRRGDVGVSEHPLLGKTARALVVMIVALAVPYSSPKLRALRVARAPGKRSPSTKSRTRRRRPPLRRPRESRRSRLRRTRRRSTTRCPSSRSPACRKWSPR